MANQEIIQIMPAAIFKKYKMIACGIIIKQRKKVVNRESFSGYSTFRDTG